MTCVCSLLNTLFFFVAVTFRLFFMFSHVLLCVLWYVCVCRYRQCVKMASKPIIKPTPTAAGGGTASSASSSAAVMLKHYYTGALIEAAEKFSTEFVGQPFDIPQHLIALSLDESSSASAAATAQQQTDAVAAPLTPNGSTGSGGGTLTPSPTSGGGGYYDRSSLVAIDPYHTAYFAAPNDSTATNTATTTTTTASATKTADSKSAAAAVSLTLPTPVRATTPPISVSSPLANPSARFTYGNGTIQSIAVKSVNVEVSEYELPLDPTASAKSTKSVIDMKHSKKPSPASTTTAADDLKRIGLVPFPLTAEATTTTTSKTKPAAPAVVVQPIQPLTPPLQRIVLEFDLELRVEGLSGYWRKVDGTPSSSSVIE